MFPFRTVPPGPAQAEQDFSQGAQRLSPFPAVEDLIGHCLKLLCDPNDPERAFVAFRDGDSVALVVNNYGGLSNLELGALTDETIQQLGKRATGAVQMPCRSAADNAEQTRNGASSHHAS